MSKAEREILDMLFVEARTHKHFSNKPVTDNMLAEIYDAAKFGPTASNSCPMRIVFVRSKEAKERLIPALPRLRFLPTTWNSTRNCRHWRLIWTILPSMLHCRNILWKKSHLGTRLFKPHIFWYRHAHMGWIAVPCPGSRITWSTPSFSPTRPGGRIF